MKIKITSKIPPPISYKETISKMETGDSFYIPAKTRQDRIATRHKLWQSAARLGVRVKSRTEGKGIRVWRVA